MAQLYLNLTLLKFLELSWGGDLKRDLVEGHKGAQDYQEENREKA